MNITRNYFTAIVGLFLASGCATGTHITTGAAKSPVNAEAVKLYQVPPAHFEILGIVNAQSYGNRQAHMDQALKELKRQAAKIGANGILIGGVNAGGGSVGVGSTFGYGGGTSFTGTGVGLSSHGIQLSGQAIFVSE